MVFVEKQKKGNHTYFYLAKTYREEGKVRKTRIFLGTDLNKTQLQPKIAEAKIELGEIDFEGVLSRKETAEFEKIKKELNEAIKQIEPNHFYEHFLTRFTYDSNAIEGSSLTLRETAFVLFEKISPANKPLKEIKEAENHKKAFDFIMGLKTKNLSKNTICKLQELVVKDTLRPDLKKFEGNIRTVNVRVGNHIAPSYYQVPSKLAALIRWYNKNSKKYHPIVVAAYFHAEFETTHPFADGNGRTGRLLMNYMLKQAGFPVTNIFLKFRFKYYGALERARKEKNLKPLIKIMKDSYKKMLQIYKK
jgi:Fic family protein